MRRDSSSSSRQTSIFPPACWSALVTSSVTTSCASSLGSFRSHWASIAETNDRDCPGTSNEWGKDWLADCLIMSSPRHHDFGRPLVGGGLPATSLPETGERFLRSAASGSGLRQAQGCGTRPSRGFCDAHP